MCVSQLAWNCKTCWNSWIQNSSRDETDDQSVWDASWPPVLGRASCVSSGQMAGKWTRIIYLCVLRANCNYFYLILFFCVNTSCMTTEWGCGKGGLFALWSWAQNVCWVENGSHWTPSLSSTASSSNASSYLQLKHPIFYMYRHFKHEWVSIVNTRWLTGLPCSTGAWADSGTLLSHHTVPWWPDEDHPEGTFGLGCISDARDSLLGYILSFHRLCVAPFL